MSNKFINWFESVVYSARYMVAFNFKQIETKCLLERKRATDIMLDIEWSAVNRVSFQWNMFFSIELNSQNS